MPVSGHPTYYLLESENPNRMLLADLESPGRGDNWLYGRPFKNPPKEPIEVCIIPGHERFEVLDFFGTPPVMSDRMHQALLRAGVDNLEVFDAILISEDEKTRLTGFKAFNIVGLIAAADLGQTAFDPNNESRLLDASIDRLAIDDDAPRGLHLFRLAEYCGAIVVHRDLKAEIESWGFPHLVFRAPEDYVS